MINSCDHGSFIVCHGATKCPVCELEKDIEDWKKDCSGYENSANELEKENKELKQRIENAAQIAADAT
jgi:hypothetical protein